jgi:hypothetical protein
MDRLSILREAIFDLAYLAMAKKKHVQAIVKDLKVNKYVEINRVDERRNSLLHLFGKRSLIDAEVNEIILEGIKEDESFGIYHEFYQFTDNLQFTD